jgi:hypothetical protein
VNPHDEAGDVGPEVAEEGPFLRVSLDGTVLSEDATLRDGGTLHIVPVLAGGTQHLKATAGRLRFTDLEWNEEGITLHVERT